MNEIRKGIILAGGKGTRLYPLTRTTCKQLLPVYDKPMVYYPFSTLMSAGIQDILIISNPEDRSAYQQLFGDGSALGISVSYAVQDQPRGLADAFLVGRDFIGNSGVALILGDNIFASSGLETALARATRCEQGATIFAIRVPNPRDFGVVEFSEEGRAISVEEKPTFPRSDYAIPGIYFYDNQVVQIASQLVPSDRGEIEITDVNRWYLEHQQLRVEHLPDDAAWFDAGSHESLLEASLFVQAMQQSGARIGSVEAVAFEQGLIASQQLEKLADELPNSYGATLGELARSCRRAA